MTLFPETMEVVGSGRFYLALAVPEELRVLKVPRPGGPQLSRNWRRRSSPRRDRAKGREKVATSQALVRRLLAAPDFELEACFPATRIVERVDVTFDWQGRRHRHRGWAYLQARVEMFDDSMPITGYPWRALVDVQKRLWAHGVGLRSGAETWGPRSWSRGSQGEIRLADLSSLTANKARVARRLGAKAREKRFRELSQRQPAACRPAIARYLSSLAEHLHAESLERVWKNPPQS